ncbi:hypothetical protein [Corynebacterium sp. CNJ-954]|uniref:hypothetical protein n=1 Tax=Corynebacterium sp. CNJ-954 TaxID=1904962 RepID=UPI001C9E7B74|nr:hypothetical protein [Corynebacterium sp. CNJ-954]
MTKPYPQEFSDDVVRVARNRQPGVPIAKIASDFGVHPMVLRRRVGTGEHDRTPLKPSAENRDTESSRFHAI